MVAPGGLQGIGVCAAKFSICGGEVPTPSEIRSDRMYNQVAGQCTADSGHGATCATSNGSVGCHSNGKGKSCVRENCSPSLSDFGIKSSSAQACWIGGVEDGPRGTADNVVVSEDNLCVGRPYPVAADSLQSVYGVPQGLSQSPCPGSVRRRLASTRRSVRLCWERWNSRPWHQANRSRRFFM